MTLDAIVAGYQDGTLVDKSDLELHNAMTKVDEWSRWRTNHPGAKPGAVPTADQLKKIHDFIETLTTKRYGCND